LGQAVGEDGGRIAHAARGPAGGARGRAYALELLTEGGVAEGLYGGDRGGAGGADRRRHVDDVGPRPRPAEDAVAAAPAHERRAGGGGGGRGEGGAEGGAASAWAGRRRGSRGSTGGRR